VAGAVTVTAPVTVTLFPEGMVATALLLTVNVFAVIFAATE
jgi:hypothetical protein